MINEIVNHIMGRLGATHRRLELPVDDIVKLLQQETLLTLSVYHPMYIECQLDLAQNLVEGMGNTYNIPRDIHGFRPIGVEKVIGSMTNGGVSGNGYNFGILGATLMDSMNNFMSEKLLNGLSNAMIPPETFQWIPPNMIRIHNTYTYQSVMLALKSTHKKDFSTFNFGLLETIKKLALADVCADLLGIRNYFQSVGSTFAEINLNIDQLKEYADKRDDLIELMRKGQLKNAGVKKIYLA
jgi:hypothetical protein